MTLSPGTTLGAYEIQSPLGAGGMGEVYRARDTRLNRTVAIKILPVHLAEKPDARERFEREARAISALNHPHICHLYDVGLQDGVRYLVMEYLEGETLANRLLRGPLPQDQFLKYGIEICDALEKAHRTGVVHRDLKPGNIMLTKSGAKLLDFGLARAVVPQIPLSSGLRATMSATMTSATEVPPLTAEGSLVGTFQYMSPEQVEGREADVRSDIFALGATLYEMATGQRAFEGKNTASVIAAVSGASTASDFLASARVPASIGANRKNLPCERPRRPLAFRPRCQASARGRASRSAGARECSRRTKAVCHQQTCMGPRDSVARSRSMARCDAFPRCNSGADGAFLSAASSALVFPGQQYQPCRRMEPGWHSLQSARMARIISGSVRFLPVPNKSSPEPRGQPCHSGRQTAPDSDSLPTAS